MKRLTFLLPLFLLILMPLATYAQDVTPWPPDSKTIFADGIEAVRAEPLANDDKRLIYVYDHTQWQTFPYPDEIKSIGNQYGFMNLLIADNGMILISANEGTADKPDGHTWILNPENGQFSRHISHCGRELSVWEIEKPIIWVYQSDANAKTPHLCNDQTGEVSPAFPEWSEWWPDHSTTEGPYPSLSPDGKWVIIEASVNEPATSTYQGSGVFNILIASYEIATKQFLKLGVGGGGDSLSLEKWLNNTEAIIYTKDMPSDFSRGYNFVDVTKTDSLQTLSSGDGYSRFSYPPYFDNPLVL